MQIYGYYQFEIGYSQGKFLWCISRQDSNEASVIINKYQGDHHVLNIAEIYPNYETLSDNIKRAMRRLRKHVGIDDKTFYWARYTWATMADKIGIPEKEISKGLGHKDNTIAGKHYIA